MKLLKNTLLTMLSLSLLLGSTATAFATPTVIDVLLGQFDDATHQLQYLNNDVEDDGVNDLYEFNKFSDRLDDIMEGMYEDLENSEYALGQVTQDEQNDVWDAFNAFSDKTKNVLIAFEERGDDDLMYKIENLIDEINDELKKMENFIVETFGGSFTSTVDAKCEISFPFNFVLCDEDDFELIEGAYADKPVIKVDMTTHDILEFEIHHIDSATGWTVNVGNSRTNNGHGGDASTQSNDSEIQILNGNLSIYANDYVQPGQTTDGNRHVKTINNFAQAGETVVLTIKDNYIGWQSETDIGSIQGDYLFAR